MLDNVASPAVRQKRSKLAPTSCQASSMFAAGTRAVNVVGFFMALLSFRGFDASSLAAQGEQRLPLIFNIQRGNAYVEPLARASLRRRSSCLARARKSPVRSRISGHRRKLGRTRF